MPQKNLAEFYSAAKAAGQALVGKLYSQELLDRVLTALDNYRKEKTSKNP